MREFNGNGRKKKSQEVKLTNIFHFLLIANILFFYNSVFIKYKKLQWNQFYFQMGNNIPFLFIKKVAFSASLTSTTFYTFGGKITSPREKI